MKLVTEASQKGVDSYSRDGFIRTTLLAKSSMPSFSSKSYFKIPKETEGKLTRYREISKIDHSKHLIEEYDEIYEEDLTNNEEAENRFVNEDLSQNLVDEEGGSASLNGDLGHNVYIKLPEGVNVKKGKVLRLKAEFVAAALASAELVSISRLAAELNKNEMTIGKLYLDNQGQLNRVIIMKIVNVLSI
ncbi:hypothetical protein AVEN_1396-1 [Araneus ventricosus]|uniref:Uncharacterized protein n=1 Tax=Araneus ventricosus TaxID=182803 RepID=A0A4Y2LU38_ARAVE|nr:hypothetical protein AVEN_1396-1 [Araneus ventricosus]